jgi:hypothetical protein
MRDQLKWALAAGLACGLCASVHGQMAGDQGAAGASLTADPELTISVKEHNFGSIDDSKAVSTEISFKNTGSAPLIIKNLRATCGCTVPALEKKRYEPGESGAFKVTFNPNHKNGDITQTVTLESNDPKAPEKQVMIRAQVTPLISVEPQTITFDSLFKGKGATKTLKIVGRTPGFEVQEITPNDATLFSAKVVKSDKVTQPDGKVFTEVLAEVSVPVTAKVGQVTGQLTIRAKDDSTPQHIRQAGVWGQVQGDLNVTPQQLFLGAVEVKKAFGPQSFTVSHRANGPFKILAAKDAPTPLGTGHQREAFTIAFKEVKTGEYQVTLEGIAPENAVGISGEVVLTTDIPDEDTIRVRYSGFARIMTPAPGTAPGAASPAGAPVAKSPGTDVKGPTATQPAAPTPKK